MRLTYQQDDNTLRLTLDDPRGTPSRVLDLPGYVDVGEGGRLVGVEVLAPPGLDLRAALRDWLADPTAGEYVALDDDSAYVTLSTLEEAIDQDQVRATEAVLIAELDDNQRLIALSIPRRGAGYEISYPSGNR